jgi:hypothetical protein
MSGRFDSWGRVQRRNRAVAQPSDFRPGETGGFLPFGNGRSYGDSCHNDQGRLFAMRPGAAISAFDPETGVLTADAGVLLSEILALVMPHGFFLEVTPGTAQVTLGGAIANDVHGKNHHRRGTFGGSVVCFTLLGSDGAAGYLFARGQYGPFPSHHRWHGADRDHRTGVDPPDEGALRQCPPDRVPLWLHIDGYFDAIDAIDAGMNIPSPGSTSWRGAAISGGAC